ncbi:MAG: putative ABC transporter permease [Sedimentibacter sp.]
MQYDIINLLLFFLIYGFCGFLLESVFRSITEKKIVVSRGFLTNGFCPLYGLCGIAIVQIFTLSEIIINGRFAALLIATIGSITIVTFLEYATGRTLDRVFHHKMWDYSEYPLNLHSYICLDFSLMWGILALLLSSFIHPLLEYGVLALNNTLKYNLIIIVSAVLTVNTSYNYRILYLSDHRLIID